MKTVLMYGTFDLLHVGHIEAFRQAKDLADGGRLIIGLSTDEFNAVKGKKAYMPYTTRKKYVEAIKYVDTVIPENNWEQKRKDITENQVDILVMGEDWEGLFDELNDICKVVYIKRLIPELSSTVVRNEISKLREINKKIVNND